MSEEVQDRVLWMTLGSQHVGIELHSGQRPVEPSCQAQSSGVTGFAEIESVNMSYRSGILLFPNG
jgi:hypothetical protein